MSDAFDGLREATNDLRTLAHLAMHLLKERTREGTATGEEELIVRRYDEAFTRMKAERIGLDNDLAGIVS